MVRIRKIFNKIRLKLEISDFYLLLEDQISIAKERWKENTKRAALQLIFWNLKALVKHHSHIEEISSSRKSERTDNKREIAVLAILCGGVGDKLIMLNYLYLLKKKYEGTVPIAIDVVLSVKEGIARAIAKEGVVFRKVFPDFCGNTSDYDVFFNSTGRYLKLCAWDREKVTNLLPAFTEYLEKCLAFEKHFNYVFSQAPFYDGLAPAITALSGSAKRIRQPDFDSSVGVREDFDYPFFISEEVEDYLSMLGLKETDYITIHRGCDTYYDSDVVKMWPLSYYESLIRLLKQTFPEKKIVQMGVSTQRFPLIEGTDVYVVGKTTFDQVKILLKYASLHVDCEGGYVHLRQWLRGGTSIVLFGPTSSDFYGYENNINIHGTGCSQPCEWLTKDWVTKCPRGFDNPPCMYSISPEMVMNKIRKAISQ